MTTTVSVIIPTFNRAGCIRRAIASVVPQILPGDEIIVVDDGSTDNTRTLVTSIGQPVRYLYVPNGGAGKARNVGIDHSRGDLIAFLDSDDEWFPGKLMLQRRLMNARADILFSFTNFSVTLKDGYEEPNYLRNWITEPLAPKLWNEMLGQASAFSTIAALPAGADDVAVHIGDMSAALMLDNYVLTSSLVVRRREAADALRFAEDLSIYEDWYCFARLSLRGQAAYIDCDTTWQHGLADKRISDAGTLARAEAWTALDERIWQTDKEFRRRHDRLRNKRIANNRIRHARGLIGAGRSREARRMLADCLDAPLSYRLLAQIPGTVLRHLVAARRRLTSIT